MLDHLNRFIHSTRGQVGQKEFASILSKIAQYQISVFALDLVFKVFSSDGRTLNTSDFLNALTQHRKTHALVEVSVVCRILFCVTWANVLCVCRIQEEVV